MALSHIGSDARVSSVSPPDGSVEAGHCATFYDQARTEMLEIGSWAFSLARASLAEVANPSSVWVYAYAKPSDCLRALRIPRASPPVTVFTQDLIPYPHTDDRDGAQYDVEGEVILTNEPAATLLYVRDVTDSTKFTPSFTNALSLLLAGYLAGPIIKGTESIRVGDALRERARAMADASATASANASSAESAVRPSLLQVRA